MTVLSRAPSTGGRRQWQVFAVSALVATALYALNGSDILGVLGVLGAGGGPVWACFAGPRRFGARPRTAWLLLGTAMLLFLIGVVVRPWATAQPPPLPLLADAATI